MRNSLLFLGAVIACCIVLAAILKKVKHSHTHIPNYEDSIQSIETSRTAIEQEIVVYRDSLASYTAKHEELKRRITQQDSSLFILYEDLLQRIAIQQARFDSLHGWENIQSAP